MIEHNKPYLDAHDRHSVLSTLQPESLAGGMVVKRLEDMFSSFLEEKKAFSCAVSSGTSALFMTLHALGVTKKDTVIVPTYVCSAVLNAVYMLGAKVLLVDVNDEDFNISFEEVKKHMNKRVKAVVIPHMYGVPADICRFKELGVSIIEDCAQAIGARYKSKYVGTIGDVAVFSFYATKIITTGHGGIVYSRNKGLVDKVLDYREFDCRKRYYPRFNFKMTDMQAALGISQLNKLDKIIKRRNIIAEKYKEALRDKKYIQVQKVTCDKKPVYYRFVVKNSNGIKKMQDFFLRRSIKTIIPIEPYELLHRYLKKDRTKFPRAEAIAKHTLSIPLYPVLRDKDVKLICQTLRDYD